MVIKRDGSICEFDKQKIVAAVEAAMRETEVGIDSVLSLYVALSVEQKMIDDGGENKTVDEIQTMVKFELMNGDRQDVAEVKTAGLLHDIGKIIISETILKKEGKLTTEEYDLMKTHSEIGFRILNSTSDMRGISNIVLNHHERWDGKGYPRGIKSDDIPFKSRIISIADAFDAMTSVRTYQETISKEEALLEIIANSGTQFDPKLVEVFKLHFDDITINLTDK